MGGSGRCRFIWGDCCSGFDEVKLMSDLAKLVIKSFPENHNMQLVCLRVVTGFQCSRCNTTKKAKLVAVVSGDWNRLLCNGCYGELLSKQ